MHVVFCSHATTVHGSAHSSYVLRRKPVCDVLQQLFYKMSSIRCISVATVVVAGAAF